MADDRTFLQRVDDYKASKTAPTLSPPPIPVSTNGTANGDHAAYTNTALQRELDQLAATTTGQRNHALNIAALKLARLPIDRDTLRTDLIVACHTNGLIRDDGLRSVEQTINSAFDKAERDGPRTIPERPPSGQVVEVDASDLTDAERRDLHALAVQRRAYDLRVNDEARALWIRQRATLTGQQRPVLTNLVDLLAQPDEDTRYRINDLLPVGGRALLAAQYKAGKTSMIANLLRSLVDGQNFLGRLSVQPVGRVVLIDTELDERMLRRWLRDQNIAQQKAVDVLCLRGRLAGFDILDPAIRTDWAEAMAGADFIVLDCLRPCLDALGLSEDKEAGRFLTAFDSLCYEAGATESAVVHHMGHGQERSRGDSRLLDWPDVLWKIVRDDQEGDTGDRYFSALGRDVNIAESRLDWTPETRALTLCDGGRLEKRARDMGTDIVEILSDPANSDGLSQNKLVGKLKALGNSREGSRRAVQLAIADHLLLTVEGPRNTQLHLLNPSRNP